MVKRTSWGTLLAGRRPAPLSDAPKRWAVERTYGWLMLHRRRARDYETLPARSEAMIHLSMTDLMAAASPARTPSPGETRHHRPNSRFRDATPG